MNPEELGLPQPPEGILDPKIPWSRINPNSRLWLILKARLTGRPQGDGYNYSSYVNISEADADRLIANMKKDPRGYPSLDQESGTPIQWMERQRLYQEWLVEAYLENPFREQVDKKIEEAEQERRLQEIQEERRKAKEERERKKQEKEQQTVPAAPAEPPLAPLVPEPKPEPEEQPEAPEALVDEQTEETPETEPETISPPIPENVPSEPPVDIIPLKFPNASRQKVVELSAILDNIGAELSSQIVLINRRKSSLRTSNQGLQLAQFLVGQQIENYREFLDDLETKSREESIDLGLDIPDIEAPEKKPIPKVPEPKPETPPKKQWWEVWKPDTKSQSPKKASAGLMSTSMPAMAEGGISPGTGLKNIIKPGIYDNPTVGNLAPGTAIIPLNRNYGKDMFGNYDEIEYMNALSEVMSLPMKGLLGSVISVFGNVLTSLGPLAGYFNTALPKLVQTAASILGMPVNAVLDMLGGPAYAGVVSNDGEERRFYKSWKIYMENNRLIFEGGVREGGGGDGGPGGAAELAKDIAKISSASDLRYVGGTNVGKLPAWIPFTQSDAKQVGYVSGFGMRRGRQHSGIDLDGDRGIKIIAPIAGKVFDINRGAVEGDRGAGGGYGNLVGLEHTSPKIFTFYGHMQDVANHLQIGSQVRAGEVIGTIGNTGYSFGPHLHWEVRKSASGDRIDPVEWTHQNKPSFASGGKAWWDPMGVFTPKTKRNYGQDYAHQERLLAAKARASQIGTSRQGSAGGPSIGGGNAGAWVPRQQRTRTYTKPSSVNVNPKAVEKTTTTIVDPNLTPMQQWAKLYPELAKKVKVGQSGYEEIQAVMQQKPPVAPSATPTSTVTATENKPAAKVTTIQMPVSKSNAIVSTAYSNTTPTFVDFKLDTNMVMELQKLRRVQ